MDQISDTLIMLTLLDVVTKKRTSCLHGNIKLNTGTKPQQSLNISINQSINLTQFDYFAFVVLAKLFVSTAVHDSKSQAFKTYVRKKHTDYNLCKKKKAYRL